MNAAILLTALAAVSAVVFIRAEYFGPRWQVYLLKPAAMMLIIALAVVLMPQSRSSYGIWVIAGLVFSLAGDVLLMVPRDRFLFGLSAFLAAHWCYIAAFVTGLADAPRLALLWPLATIGLVLFAIIRPVGRLLRLAVMIYVVSIVLMGWLALERWQDGQPGAWAAASGALLFMFSDTLIGIRRFRAPWPAAQALILGSYFPAQWLIAWSVR